VHQGGLGFGIRKNALFRRSLDSQRRRLRSVSSRMAAFAQSFPVRGTRSRPQDVGNLRPLCLAPYTLAKVGAIRLRAWRGSVSSSVLSDGLGALDREMFP
jgi:hypothetical protein